MNTIIPLVLLAGILNFFGIGGSETPAYETAMQAPVKKTIGVLQRKYPIYPIGRGGAIMVLKSNRNFWVLNF